MTYYVNHSVALATRSAVVAGATSSLFGGFAGMLGRESEHIFLASAASGVSVSSFWGAAGSSAGSFLGWSIGTGLIAMGFASHGMASPFLLGVGLSSIGAASGNTFCDSIDDSNSLNIDEQDLTVSSDVFYDLI